MSSLLKSLLSIIGILILITCIANVTAQTKFTWKKISVLVYTKNGKGYVHDNILNTINCIVKLGKQHGFKVDTASNAAVMTTTNLTKYTLIVFANTNNDVFDTNEQRLAFRQYIEAGGGMVGIHSVAGTERNWTWFKMMMGGTFSWHPTFQQYSLNVIDTANPGAKGLPKVWQKYDECYFWKELYPGPHVFLAHDLHTLTTTDSTERTLITNNKGSYGQFYPAAWTHEFDGGHIWITALGHDKDNYEEPIFVNHILTGIRYVAGKVIGLDYKKAYADGRDTPVR